VLKSGDIDWAAREAGAEALFGPFATRQHVRQALEALAAAEGLCWRQLGFEKRGGPCFARQVRKCRGACIGEETPEQHNLRLVTALAPHRVRDWPFAGRIVIRERHADGAFEEAHVFERWCHLGTARTAGDLEELLDSRIGREFDPDIYRILAAYVDRHPAAVRVMARRPSSLSEAF
jgi:DNA polymerase-3 subunit epsilon